MKIAVTGHRPQRLNYEDKEIKAWMNEQIMKLGKDNIEEAYCGMAQGADQIFGKVVVKNHIPLICCYPFKKKKVHEEEQKLMDAAKDVRYISEVSNKKAYWLRDKYMVDNCDVLLAVFDGKENGGTWLTIKEAKKQGKPIIMYNVGNKKWGQ